MTTTNIIWTVINVALSVFVWWHLRQAEALLRDAADLSDRTAKMLRHQRET